MKFFENRTTFRYLFILIAVIIAVSSLLVSNSLVQELSQEERNKMRIWAEATKELVASEENISMNLIVQILESNTTIPVILEDRKAKIYTSTNIALPETYSQEFLEEKARLFESKHEPIKIEEGEIEQYVYYDDSYTLKRLLWYPYIQLSVLTIFILVSFLALLTTKKMEQDRVWVGLTKETAHQLGTPLSSLMAWIEYLRLKNVDEDILSDMEKDVSRLQMITDRFSKIGSKEVLKEADVRNVIEQTLTYLSSRISQKVSITKDLPDTPILSIVNEPLLGWVVENLIKNAVDSMEGVGSISISLLESNKNVAIYISDTGKGIPKSKYKTIFNPGYTSKSRGWGLGLSLAKRIIESYHGGKIYVKNSELNVGTTFCIELVKGGSK